MKTTLIYHYTKTLILRLLYPFILLILLAGSKQALAQPPLAITIVSTQNPTCTNFGRNGNIYVSATGGYPPYKYSMDGVRQFNIGYFPLLDIGNYTMVVTDAVGQTSSAQVRLTNSIPRLDVSIASVTRATSCDAFDGSVTLQAIGGSPPYQYSIGNINYQTSNVITGLSAGRYYFYVKDANGCIARVDGSPSAHLLDPVGCVKPSIQFPGEGACLYDLADVNVDAGTDGGPYTYSMDGINYQASGLFQSKLAGIYPVYIKDPSGNITIVTAAIPQSCNFWFTCFFTGSECGQNNGTITVTPATNQFAPYSYSIDGINFQSSNVFINLTQGSYYVTVRGSAGVTESRAVTMSGTCPSVEAYAEQESCRRNDGSITANARGSYPPYQYSLDDNNYQWLNRFTGLTAGNYFVTIRDARGNKATVLVTVTLNCYSVTATLTHTTCNERNGSIVATALSGTPPYRYAINGPDYQSSNVFTGLAPGNYTITARDATDRSVFTMVTINGSTNNVSLQAGDDLIICKGKDIKIVPTSNADSFTWSPITGLDDPNTLSPLTSPATTTKYYITATLALCKAVDSVTVIVNPDPVAIAGIGTVICKGQNTHLHGSGGDVYQWTPATYLSDPTSKNPEVINPLSNITYQLHVEDANGCRSIQPSLVTIDVRSNPKVFAGNDTSIVTNQPFRLSATDINNTGFTSYTWSPSTGLDDPLSQYPVVTTDHEMTYKVTASITSGCEVTDEITIKAYLGPDIYVPNAFTPNNDGLNDVIRAVPIGIKKFRHFIIFNRWGQRVFYTTDPSRSWDGRNAAMSLDTGIFVWMAEGTDDKGHVIQKKGTITLVR